MPDADSSGAHLPWQAGTLCGAFRADQRYNPGKPFWQDAHASVAQCIKDCVAQLRTTECRFDGGIGEYVYCRQ
jgi:hypothetical protein